MASEETEVFDDAAAGEEVAETSDVSATEEAAETEEDSAEVFSDGDAFMAEAGEVLQDASEITVAGVKYL